MSSEHKYPPIFLLFHWLNFILIPLTHAFFCHQAMHTPSTVLHVSFTPFRLTPTSVPFSSYHVFFTMKQPVFNQPFLLLSCHRHHTLLYSISLVTNAEHAQKPYVYMSAESMGIFSHLGAQDKPSQNAPCYSSHLISKGSVTSRILEPSHHGVICVPESGINLGKPLLIFCPILQETTGLQLQFSLSNPARLSYCLPQSNTAAVPFHYLLFLTTIWSALKKWRFVFFLMKQSSCTCTLAFN